MKPFVRCALALALAAASGAASALGLGEIVVRSRLDQPLLAEIPIISSDPSELAYLQARLASPDTFARVGLEPPQGVVSDLRFAVALDNDGNPVVRVTSAEPVTQAMLTFLVEVDWGQGRLVREYSALLDAPRTVSAPVQPAIEAPAVSPSNVIERPPVAQAPTQPVPAEAEPLPPEPVAVRPVPEPEPAAEASTAVAPTAPPPVAAPARPARTLSSGAPYRVQAGDTLSQLANELRAGTGVNLNQAMVALLRSNPDAFIGGNVNRIKAGAVLQVPGRGELSAVDAGEANALVREQTRIWRQGATAVPQPAVADGATVAADTPTNTPAAAAATAVADARLEIVPPGASDASKAGNQSGMSAGGEGDMLLQETQARETLAAREAELDEMKARVAELEKLQTQQQQLIEMKDSELAAVQQRLAAADRNTPQAAAPTMPWIFGGAGLLVLGLALGWFMRRRAKPVFRAPDTVRPSIADGFAASMATGAAATAVAGGGLDDGDDEAGEGDGHADGIAGVDDIVAADIDIDIAPVAEAPVQAELDVASGGSDERFGPDEDEDEAPAWHVDAKEPAVVAETAGGGNERLELARAYLALGDRDSARQLLTEVRLHGDLAARQHAMQLLRDLE